MSDDCFFNPAACEEDGGNDAAVVGDSYYDNYDCNSYLNFYYNSYYG